MATFTVTVACGTPVYTNCFCLVAENVTTGDGGVGDITCETLCSTYYSPSCPGSTPV